MSLLLDTHILVWLANAPTRFSDAERQLLFDPALDIVVSAVAIWEIGIKSQLRFASGAPKLPLAPEAAVRLAEAMRYRLLPLSVAHAATPLESRMSHRDPFDELLLVQAQCEGLRLLTRDHLLKDHPLALVA